MDQTLIEVSVPNSKGKLPVSVVIPCYRCTHTIRAAVNSVMNQTVWPMEIILVEDCCADGGQTLSLLEKIKTELQGEIRIKVLSLPENRGPGEARNAGWSVAGQEFIAFLDADDTWHPRKLEIQIAWMMAHPDYVLTCHDSMVCSKGGLPPLPTKAVQEQTVRWRLMLFRNDIATRTVILKRRITQRFPAGVRHAEDYGLWLRILLEEGAVMRLCLPLACSYKAEFGAGGLSGDLAAMHKGSLNCFERLFEDRLISWSMYFLAVVFETLKYWRRIAVTVSRRGSRLDKSISSHQSGARYD